MQRRDFLTTTAVGLIGTGLTVPAIAAPTVIGHEHKSWAGRDLSGLVLRDMDLAGADLRGCRMNGTDFRRADLRDTRLDQATIAESKFDGARMTGASLEGATITGASFRYANLTGCIIGGATITDTYFEHAEMPGVGFRGAQFGDLIGFDHAVLDAADFRDTMLSGMMMFGNCRMAGAVFAGMKCLPWIESPASALLFDGADARRIDLTGIKANISCEGANFRDATLTGADFCVRHPDASPDGSWWTGADFSGADLRGANLSPMSFGDVVRGEAEFRPPLFIGANLVGATLDFRIKDELGRPENRARLVERFVNVPDTIFAGAVFGNTRINGKLHG